MILTDHAIQRMRQRGIDEQVVDYLLSFGREHHDSHGGSVIWLDKRARRFIRGELGAEGLARLEKHLDAYAVVGNDGAIITVGRRYRRVKH